MDRVGSYFAFYYVRNKVCLVLGAVSLGYRHRLYEVLEIVKEAKYNDGFGSE